MSKITTVVFDLGNVLIDWDPRYLYRKLFSTETEVEWFLDNVCNDEWNKKHDAGQPFEKGIAELTALYPQFSEQIRNWYDRCEETLGPMDETVEVLAELKKNKIPLFVLSNWSAETFPKAEVLFDFLNWFDGKIISGEIGKIKPDPEIYNILLNTFDLIPQNTVFIDDKLENVEAATNLGMHGIHFHSADLLRNDLKILELL
ncbi:MAG: HAD family phosphatase [SAR324 cluster bacterium]|nr:HAD family phosphatase [SAR324 cluster bacterium]MBL7035148.1 HAD family phosphatase [SAR324 cluster bacterium]